jgi:uncharacterized protein with HEPN domain
LSEILRRHPQVDWSGAKGMRDILSHHYFRADAKVVFSVCREKLPGLGQAITAMQKELANHIS